MSRERSIERATKFFESGEFLAGLQTLVSIRSESQNLKSNRVADDYLRVAMVQILERSGFSCRIFQNPAREGPNILVAERIEGDNVPTILIYGHGDVVSGMEGRWSQNLTPWNISVVGDKWFGRGTADNKGQHWTNLAALQCLLDAEGRLGFNVKFLLEMGEEIGSPGLHEFCRLHRQELRADVLLASDGPRLHPGRPTMFMGNRGSVKFGLRIHCRENQHHSGNWGGILKDPVIRLSHAIATITDKDGRLLIEEWRPPALDEKIRASLFDCDIPGLHADARWGEPGLTPAESLYAWNSFTALAIHAGDIDNPVNAIQGEAVAVCQLRFVVGLDPRSSLDHLRAHLDREGFQDVAIEWIRDADVAATRLDLSSPWVEFVADSILRTVGQWPARLPNLSGALPNDCFSEILGLPTIWIPHSYPSCGQHAPDEHALAPLLHEGLKIMTGIFWDIGHASQIPRSSRARTMQ